MIAIVNRLAEEWKAGSSVGFADRARAAIIGYRPTKEKKDLKDKKRLGTLASELCNLRKLCVDANRWHPEFLNELRRLEAKFPTDPLLAEIETVLPSLTKLSSLQRRLRRQTGLSEFASAFSKLHSIPDEVRALHLTTAESIERKAAETDRVEKKLAIAKNFNCDALMAASMNHLTAQSFNEVVPALLLATGRRSVEVLKTGGFEIVSEYRVRFSGQAKKGDIPGAPFEIDLLAPAAMVITGIDWLRKNYDCKDLSNLQVHTKYGKCVQLAVKKHMQTNAHSLRAINAVACEQLWNKGKKSFIGYLKDQLGHVGTMSPALYQCVNVIVTRPFGVAVPVAVVEVKAEPVVEVKAVLVDFGLLGYSKPTKAKVAEIADMMRAKTRITASAIHTQKGGSVPMIQRILLHADNGKIIAAHNNTLKVCV